MQDTDDPRLCAHMFGIRTQCQKCFMDTAEQKTQQELPVVVYDVIEFVRQGEDHMVIGNPFDQFCIALHLPFFSRGDWQHGQERMEGIHQT